MARSVVASSDKSVTVAAKHVINECRFQVNNFIEVWSQETLALAAEQPDDTGILHCYPVYDNEFSVKLSYLIYSDKNTVTEYTITFHPSFFAQFPQEAVTANAPFRFDRSGDEHFPVCTRSAEMLSGLFAQEDGAIFTRVLKRTNLCVGLLARALECIVTPFAACQVPACRFLGNSTERDRIDMAVRIVEENINNPLTIKELARKAAINECYLKKGFKTVTGKTIHEYQMSLRIARAKELLSKNGVTVTEVAAELGFSSISHFSTAFKKYTGLKPCALLS